MVDVPSDQSSAASSTSSPPKKPAPRIQVSVSEDPQTEKAVQHSSVMFTARRSSRLDKEDDEEEEDLDALIEELESLDPEADVEAEIETVGGARNVPEELLQTDTRVGLIEPEVVARRKKFGLNQMKEEKENLLLKFLGYFVGPIQFVMEVCKNSLSSHADPVAAMLLLTIFLTGRCHSCCRAGRLGRFRCHLCATAAQCHRGLRPGIPGWVDRGGTEKDFGFEGGCPPRRPPS